MRKQNNNMFHSAVSSETGLQWLHSGTRWHQLALVWETRSESDEEREGEGDVLCKWCDLVFQSSPIPHTDGQPWQYCPHFTSQFVLLCSIVPLLSLFYVFNPFKQVKHSPVVNADKCLVARKWIRAEQGRSHPCWGELGTQFNRVLALSFCERKHYTFSIGRLLGGWYTKYCKNLFWFRFFYYILIQFWLRINVWDSHRRYYTSEGSLDD